MCPAGSVLVPDNSFVLCQDEHSDLLTAVPPEQCTQASSNVLQFECLATMEQLHTEDGMACADIMTFDSSITNAIKQYCCSGAAPAAGPTQYAEVQQVPCGGQCVQRSGVCAGSTLPEASACCSAEDVCVMQDDATARCVADARYVRKLQRGWNGTVLQCDASI